MNGNNCKTTLHSRAEDMEISRQTDPIGKNVPTSEECYAWSSSKHSCFFEGAKLSHC
jgi:hypothetical protein